MNGPFAIKNSSGVISAEIMNGPISYAGNSGDVHLRAENGPIAVKLAGTYGMGRDSTRNLPMVLSLSSCRTTTPLAYLCNPVDTLRSTAQVAKAHARILTITARASNSGPDRRWCVCPQ